MEDLITQLENIIMKIQNMIFQNWIKWKSENFYQYDLADEYFRWNIHIKNIDEMKHIISDRKNQILKFDIIKKQKTIDDHFKNIKLYIDKMDFILDELRK